MRAQKAVAAVSAIILLVAATAPALAKQSQTASEFYMAYRAAFDKAKTIEEVLPLMSKETRAKVEATPAAERPKMFAFVKENSKMTNVRVVKETKTQQGVTLTVEALSADNQAMTGQILIVKEGGAWKLGKESWSTKPS